ncbi:hypothetical protein F5146DRAFT_571772 [Armillaria mellea]|nr:hypothetical protein F5146DRAFT_571772 [Armillaria mellea]
MSIRHAVDETLAYLCTPYNESVFHPPGLRCGSRLDRSLGDPSAITKLILLCIKVVHSDQCSILFNRMAPKNRLGSKGFASWKHYEPLVLDMASIADEHPELKPAFSIFFTNAISELVRHRKRDEWEPVVVALKHCEDDHLAELFNPSFIASLEEDLIKVVARVLYDKASVAASQSAATPVSIIDLLDFAYGIGCGDTLSQDVLGELTFGTSTVRDEDSYVNTKLAPFFFGLFKKMSYWNRSFAEPPFFTFCADTLRLFARHCMPAKPAGSIPAEILAFGCGTPTCQQCKGLRHFLCLSSQEVYHFTGVDSIRNHLEYQLHLSSALKHGVSFDTVKPADHSLYRSPNRQV